MDYASQVPADWKPVMIKGDQQWIGITAFSSKNIFSDTAAATLRWYPPITEACTRTTVASTRPNPKQ